jgi:hypothetical protein
MGIHPSGSCIYQALLTLSLRNHDRSADDKTYERQIDPQSLKPDGTGTAELPHMRTLLLLGRCDY